MKIRFIEELGILGISFCLDKYANINLEDLLNINKGNKIQFLGCSLIIKAKIEFTIQPCGKIDKYNFAKFIGISILLNRNFFYFIDMFCESPDILIFLANIYCHVCGNPYLYSLNKKINRCPNCLFKQNKNKKKLKIDILNGNHELPKIFRKLIKKQI